MLTLDASKLARESIPVATGWLLGACMEARGKQDLWIKQKPEVLEVLREQAIIQSAESSIRIEGVTVAANRLRPLVIGGAKPRDRSEEEISGYRAALHWIFARRNRLTVTPDVLRRLHAYAQGGTTGDAGEWKSRDKEVIEILPNGERSVRFLPVSAKRTPAAVEQLCNRYREACDEEHVPPLLIVATFVFDFLCIQPFRDGNGRVSRLLTALLLQSHGFQVARYISLERVVEESRDEYYRVLKLCSQVGMRGRTKLSRGGIISWACCGAPTGNSSGGSSRPSPGLPRAILVRQTVLEQVEQFTLADMAAHLPSASSQLIKKVLAELKDAKRVRLVGRGRGARWEVIRR
jgi:fido (protein-threonine AMPylation protein)